MNTFHLCSLANVLVLERVSEVVVVEDSQAKVIGPTSMLPNLVSEVLLESSNVLAKNVRGDQLSLCVVVGSAALFHEAGKRIDQTCVQICAFK